MQLNITAQTIITAGAVLGGAGTILAFVIKGVRWFDRQKKQDTDLVAIKKKHEEDIKSIQKEQTLIVYGLLACLKGLQEKGCNGPVTEAIDKLEKYLNIEAHKQ